MARICDICGFAATSVGPLHACACGCDFCSQHGNIGRGMCDLCIDAGVPDKTSEPIDHVVYLRVRAARAKADGLEFDRQVMDGAADEIVDLRRQLAEVNRQLCHGVRGAARLQSPRFGPPRRRDLPVWGTVGEVFGTGSTMSCDLCRLAGIDPETGEKVPQ